MPTLNWLTRDTDIHAARDDLSPADKKALIRLVAAIKKWEKTK